MGDLDYISTMRTLKPIQSRYRAVSSKETAFCAYGTNSSKSKPYSRKSEYQQIRNRWYSPTHQRWLNKDPLGYDAGDVNLYRFEGNDPINKADALGLASTVPAIPFISPTMIEKVVDVVITTAESTGEIIGEIGIGVLWPIIGIGDGGPSSATDPNANSRARANNDPYTLPIVNPGRTECGKCKPCPPNGPPWEHDGNKHGSTSGSHWHQIRYHQEPQTCICRPKRENFPTQPQ